MIKIPAIDIINGKVVRLTKGDFNTETKYEVDLVQLAKSYEDAGAQYLHIVDLDGARGLPHNRKAISEVVSQTNLKVQLGGGIRSEDVLQECFDMGVSSCILGSIAVSKAELVANWLSKYESNQIIIGADVKDNKIATEGWLETSGVTVSDFIKQYKEAGADTFLCTDISLDGTLSGVAIDLYRKLMKENEGVNIIASGGVSSLADLEELEESNLYGVVIGKALLEGRFQAKDLYTC